MYEEIGVVKNVQEGVEWVIADYFSHSGTYRSPTFSFAAASFEMMINIYPIAPGVGADVELGLDKTKTGGPPIYLDFSFSVKTRDGKKYGETPWIDFQNNTKFFPCEMKLDAKRMSELVPRGTLTILCTLKPKQIKEDEPGLVEDFKQLFLSQEDSDVILRVKEREFKAHKIILKARSPVFKSIFRSDTKENATGIVDIPDLDPSVFADFLCFLYCGEFDGGDDGPKDARNVLGLFAAADKYDVPNLRAQCIQFMENHLSIDMFCDVIRLALLHSETKLIQLSTDYFIRKASRIIKTAEWKRFVAENPVKSNELFMKYRSSDEYDSDE